MTDNEHELASPKNISANISRSQPPKTFTSSLTGHLDAPHFSSKDGVRNLKRHPVSSSPRKRSNKFFFGDVQ